MFMADFVVWLGAHWKDVAMAIIAIDYALIPLIPNAGFLVVIAKFLSGLVGSKPAA